MIKLWSLVAGICFAIYSTIMFAEGVRHYVAILPH